jgi:rhodanese-related sulfurtransferase
MVIAQSQPAGALISQQELLQQMQSVPDMLLIDVRSPDEFSMGHVPGAVNIPYQELADRLGDVRPRHEKGVVLYCESGRRAGIAEGILRKAGLDNIRHLEGDMSAWRQSKLPIEKDAH